jgi:tRNA (mo5U34)-methyltransferase
VQPHRYDRIVPASSDQRAIKDRIDDHTGWYHSIELAPGVVTPGIHDSAHALAVLDSLGFPSDLEGKRVLDVGCRDGFFAFEAEGRGGVVVGIDYADPEMTGFPIASEILGSNVEYHTENVYELAPETYGQFDVILFLGVLYHLRNPLLALDRLRSLAAVGALIVVETEVSTDPDLVDLATPTFEFLPRDQLAGDATNMWAPNVAGLVAVLAECQFSAQAVKRTENRAWVLASAVDDVELEQYRLLDSSRGQGGQD